MRNVTSKKIKPTEHLDPQLERNTPYNIGLALTEIFNLRLRVWHEVS